MAGGYKTLVVWQAARALAIDVYRLTAERRFRGEWALRDQLRRAALSVPSNIAEGSARGSNADSVRFFFFARASLAELATQSDIAAAVGLLDPAASAALEEKCDHISRMLMRLMKTRS